VIEKRKRVHSRGESVERVWRTGDGRPARWLQRRKDMSKSNDTTKTRELTEAELAAVSGGYTFTDVMVESFFGGLGDDTLVWGAVSRNLGDGAFR
jgi:hypothetical protein